MDKKKILGIALLIGAAIAGWYFFIRKAGSTAAAKVATAAGLGSADNAAYNAIIAVIKSDMDPFMLTWLIPYVQQTLTGTNANPLSQDYYVAGKLSKAGTLVGEYARAYHINGTFEGKRPGDAGYNEARQRVNDKVYAIFYQFRQAYLNELAGA